MLPPAADVNKYKDTQPGIVQSECLKYSVLRRVSPSNSTELRHPYQEEGKMSVRAREEEGHQKYKNNNKTKQSLKPNIRTTIPKINETK